MSKQSIHCVQNKLHSMVRMSKQSIHCVQNNYIQWYACRSSRYDYSWEDADSESELYALELEVPFIAISTAILVLKILGGGRLNPTLSLFAGGWDAVLVDGCGTGTGGRGRLGLRTELVFPS